MTAIQELPTLNVLSRRQGGPGYVGPCPEPPPGLMMKINDLTFELVDEPMESWLQHMNPVWQQERAEQERREQLLKVRKNLAVATRNMTTGDRQPHAIMNQNELEGMRVAINRYNSTAYYQRRLPSFVSFDVGFSSNNTHAPTLIGVQSLTRTLSRDQTLKKAPLLSLHVATIDVGVGMDGAVGSFYDPQTVLRVMRNHHLFPEYKVLTLTLYSLCI
jgi:hypothetical protein